MILHSFCKGLDRLRQKCDLVKGRKRGLALVKVTWLRKTTLTVRTHTVNTGYCVQSPMFCWPIQQPCNLLPLQTLWLQQLLPPLLVKCNCQNFYRVLSFKHTVDFWTCSETSDPIMVLGRKVSFGDLISAVVYTECSGTQKQRVATCCANLQTCMSDLHSICKCVPKEGFVIRCQWKWYELCTHTEIIFKH